MHIIRKVVAAESSDGPRQLVVRRAFPDPGRPKDRDGATYGRHRVEAFHELRQDPQCPPRIGIQERGRWLGSEELLVLGRCLIAPHPVRGDGGDPQSTGVADLGSGGIFWHRR